MASSRVAAITVNALSGHSYPKQYKSTNITNGKCKRGTLAVAVDKWETQTKSDCWATHGVARLQEALQLAGIPGSEVDVLADMRKALTNRPVASLPQQQR